MSIFVHGYTKSNVCSWTPLVSSQVSYMCVWYALAYNKSSTQLHQNHDSNVRSLLSCILVNILYNGGIQGIFVGTFTKPIYDQRCKTRWTVLDRPSREQPTISLGGVYSRSSRIGIFYIYIPKYVWHAHKYSKHEHNCL